MTNVDNPFKSPAVLSLCTGMRGLERGLERAIGAVRTVAYVEIEAFVIENLVRQMEQGILAPAPIFTNVKTFPAEQFHGKIHGITGGYPCQPFSAAGLRKGTDDTRHLFPFIRRIIRKSKPDWVFFENVEGHLSLGFERVQKDLRQLGYSIEAGIFTAQEVGAPHKRARLFILGLENSIIKRMRRGDYKGTERWQEGRLEIQIEGPSELGYSEHDGPHSAAARRSTFQASDQPEKGSSPSCESEGTSGRKLNDDLQNGEGGQMANAKGELRQQSWDTWNGRTGLANGSAGDEQTMGNTNEQGLQGRDSRFGKERTGERLAWPTGPSKQQGEWEPPRIESSLGYVVNGYNFREDLLRMAGNGVVEQTAELAFITLWEKHVRAAGC